MKGRELICFVQNVENRFQIQQSSAHIVEQIVRQSRILQVRQVRYSTRLSRKLGSAFNEVKQSFTGSNNQNNNQGYNANQNYSNGYNNGTIPPYSGTRLKDDRGLASYIILSIITCGIYSYIHYKMAHDVNIACDGDGENTSGLVAFVLYHS